MKIWTLTEIAAAADPPVPTVGQMVQRKVLPAPTDVGFGQGGRNSLGPVRPT
jgi:hypothetical protein